MIPWACALAALGAAADVPAFEEAPPAFEARAFGSIKTQASLNVRPDADASTAGALARNLLEGTARASLGVDVKRSASVRVVVEGRVLWRGVTQPGLNRAHAMVEPSVGEAYVDLYGSKVDFRVGNQVVAFGANPLYAPSDLLNPRDLRSSFLQSDPEDTKLPAPAVRAAGDLGPLNWSAVYFPFFIPNRYDVFGTNAALLQPTLGITLPNVVSSSLTDQLQDRLLETSRPNAWPWLGDLGLRARTTTGGVKWGLSWVWMNEKLPEVAVDPQLAALAGSVLAGRPPDFRAALAVENRLLAGQRLFSGTYQRQHIFSAEGSLLLGPAQLDVDVGFSPAQTFIDGTFEPVRKSALTWVVGLTQAKDSPLLYSVTYLGVAVPDVKAGQFLLLFEPTSAQGAARVAVLHVLLATASYRFDDARWEVGVRGALELGQGSAAVGPRVSCRLFDRFHAWVGAEFYQGNALSPFGYFNRANQVLAGLNADLF